MVKGLICIAKAGAGKTTFITNEKSSLAEDLQNRRVLYITFTNQNTENLREKLLNSKINFKYYKVMTFFSFIFQDFIKPYRFSIEQNFKLRSISGLYFRNPVGKSCINHNDPKFWQNKSGGLYGDKLSALITDKRYEECFNLAIKRLNLFYDYLIIDEFQDIVYPELKIIKKLGKKVINTHLKILMVGDLFQSCVEKTSKNFTPYNKLKVEDSEKDFIRSKLEFRQKYFDIETKKLSNSYRVCKNVCNYINKNLFIDIGSNVSTSDRNGKIKLCKNLSDVRSVLRDASCKILVYSKNIRQQLCENYNIDNKRIINYGMSKGMQYLKVAIILTNELSAAVENEDFTQIKPSSINKFYVALTRSKTDVFLILSKSIKNIGTKSYDQLSLF